jgi:hypothetical protein
MKIVAHSESHIVRLEDGSEWQVFPGDLHLTLDWRPETELEVENIDDEINSHALVASANPNRVRVIPAGASWPASKVKNVLKDG